jgi:8-oxo-dGTP pyrophosphatase MutT (NUDIX family)
MTNFEIRIFGVGAILFTPDRKYLMQLRDDRPDVSMRGHWGLFGGVIEEGEDPSAALVRELREELDFVPDHVAAPFSQLVFDLGFAGRGIDRKIFFAVPIAEESLSRMRLGEGQRMALFRLDELLREPRVTPWDLYGVLLHHRRISVASALRRSDQA